MINLWLALRDDSEAELAIWRASPEALTADQIHIKNALLSHPDLQHIEDSTKRMPDAAASWGMYSIYMSGDSAAMATLDSWLALYAGKAFVCGCWDWGGAQVGGYATDPRTKNFMPDDVTYDQNGAETGRTAATGPKQVNLMAGQSPRLFA